MASDSDLKRARLRWRDASAIIAKREEAEEEEPPLEALRVWSALRTIRPTTEHENERKGPPDPVQIRQERKRRDAFVANLKEQAMQGTITLETSWEEYQRMAVNDGRLLALRDGPGATAQELWDEFQEELRQGAVLTMEPPSPTGPADEVEEPDLKRQRKDPAVAAAAQAAAARVEAAVASRASPEEKKVEEGNATEDISALDQMIMDGVGDKKDKPAEEEEDPLMAAADKAVAQEEDPLMAAANKAVEEEDPLMAAASKATEKPKLTAAELSSKKLDDLKTLCRQHSLKVSGNKQELIDRLFASGKNGSKD